MSGRDSVKVVKRAYEAFQKGDIEALLAILTDDVEWETLAVEGVPWAGRRHGKAEVREFFGTLDEHEEVLAFEPREFIAQGEKVAVCRTLSGASKGYRPGCRDAVGSHARIPLYTRPEPLIGL